MDRSCFVCIIKPLVYFTYFSYGFVDIQCPHGFRATDKARIRRNATHWRITLLLHSALAVMSLATLYMCVKFQEFDYFSLLTRSELLFLQMGLARLTWENVGWRERLKEMQVMLCIWNYVGTFRRDRSHFFLNRQYPVGLTLGMLVCFVLAGPYFFIGEVTFFTYLEVMIRFLLGFVVTSTYLNTVYDFVLYKLLFKWTFAQIQAEVETKLLETSWNLKVEVISKASDRSSFTRKLTKLRKLYIATVGSFRRMKKVKRSYIISLLLIYNFLLIFIYFLIFLVIRGELHLKIGHYLYFVKNFAYFLEFFVIFYTCEDIEARLQQIRTFMFKIPLDTLSASEAREVEVFTKCLAWEEPNDPVRDFPVYKMNLLMNLFLGVITNTMVAIQLYFWFSKEV